MKNNANIYIIGCGNELAGDDGVGIAVVRRLAAETKLPGGVQIIEAGIPGLALVELMLGAGKVILVDSFLGGAPGTVRCFREEELPPPGYNAGQSHGIGLREALSFARGVMPGNFPGQVVVVGVEIERPRRWVQGLSPAVEAAVGPAVEMVLAQLNTWR